MSHSHALHTNVLNVSDLSLAIDGCHLLQGMSFAVQKGEFTCICGPNGAGKTVLMKSILGLLPAEAKRFELFGQPLPTPSARHAVRKKIGYVPQRKTFDRRFPAKVLDLLIAAHRSAWPFRIAKAERASALEALSLVHGEALIDKDLASLSGGEIQRAFLARALITRPELLVLDEPMAGVDVHGRGDMLELLKNMSLRQTPTVLMITHSDMVVQQCAHKVLYIVGGQLRAHAKPSELITQKSFVEGAFGGPDHEMAVSSFADHDHHHHDEEH